MWYPLVKCLVFFKMALQDEFGYRAFLLSELQATYAYPNIKATEAKLTR